MTVERHRVPVPAGTLALLWRQAARRDAPCVVACHDLVSSKDDDALVLLEDALASAGLAVARFDFRGSGESTGAEQDTTIASRLEDLQGVLAFLAGRGGLGGGGLLGVGLGGFVALLAARGLDWPVVTWNAPASLTELANDDLAEGRGLGVPFAIEYATGRYALAPRGVGRHLIVHGEADTVFGVEHGAALHEQAGEPCDLLLIPGADHRLSAPSHRAQAIDRSRDWLRRHLGRGG